MQLDIFEHSRDVMLANAAVEALRRRDAAAGEAAVAALAAEFGTHPLLESLGILLARLRRAPATPADRGRGQALLDDTERCAEAARVVFGGAADDWLAPVWQELAAAIEHLPFDPQQEALHPAPLLIRARRWAEAGGHSERIPAWRRQPAPLAWKLECEYRTGGLEPAWPLLAELAWIAPGRAERVLRLLSDPALDELLRSFDRDYEGDGDDGEFAWFPAWVLVVEPRCAAELRLAQAGASSGPERAFRLLLDALSLERQGRHGELMAVRRQLRDMNRALFERYMRTR